MDWLWEVLRVFFIIAGIALLIAAIALAILYRRIKKVTDRIDPRLGFWATLRETPFALVVILDLLDLGLDFLSAPVSYFLLNRLGLQRLREFTLIEALLPGTQFVPTLTVAWTLARKFPWLGGGGPMAFHRDAIDVPSTPTREKH